MRRAWREWCPHRVPRRTSRLRRRGARCGTAASACFGRRRVCRRACREGVVITAMVQAASDVTFAETSDSNAAIALDSWRNRQETPDTARYSDRLMKSNWLNAAGLVHRGALGVLSMKRTAKLVTIMIALSLTSVVAADWPWLYGPRRNHTSEQKGLLADMAAGRSEGALDGPDGRRLRWAGCPWRERVPAGPRREGRRHAARPRSRERQGTVDVRLRRARQLHVRRLTHDADRGRRARLHRRADGRSARDQHEDAEARLAQEHLEGFRRRRPTATVGDRPESVDLR